MQTRRVSLPDRVVSEERPRPNARAAAVGHCQQLDGVAVSLQRRYCVELPHAGDRLHGVKEVSHRRPARGHGSSAHVLHSAATLKDKWVNGVANELLVHHLMTRVRLLRGACLDDEAAGVSRAPTVRKIRGRAVGMQVTHSG